MPPSFNYPKTFRMAASRHVMSYHVTSFRILQTHELSMFAASFLDESIVVVVVLPIIFG